MRISTFALGALALGLSPLTAGPAAANGDDLCFDKGTLKYAPCPKEPVAPAPEPEPVVDVVDKSGFYLGLTGGVAYLDDTEVDRTGGLNRVDVEYDLGWALQGQIGYEFDDLFAPNVDLRLDLEAGYMTAEVDRLSVGGVNVVGSSGEFRAFSLTTNAYLDYNITDRLDVFVGGGAGLGFTNTDDYRGNGVSVFDGDDTVFAFHLDAGVSFDVTEMVVLEARYRYMNFVNVEASGSAAAATANTTQNVDAHLGLVGLRLKF